MDYFVRRGYALWKRLEPNEIFCMLRLDRRGPSAQFATQFLCFALTTFILYDQRLPKKKAPNAGAFFH